MLSQMMLRSAKSPRGAEPLCSRCTREGEGDGGGGDDKDSRLEEC